MNRYFWARALVLALFRFGVRVGSLTIVEDGRRKTFGKGAPTATVHVRSPQFWTAILRGSRGLADAYADELWDSPDMVAVIRVAARNAIVIDRVRAWFAPVRWPIQRVRAVVTRNTRARSRAGIAAHYDLGNELFSRMLDPTMMYSAAYFEHPGMTLEEASRAKLELVCQKLDLGPDDRVVEIGTGWGGFAIYAASTRGCHVTTTTISREQHDFAAQRIAEAGLEDRITLLLRDYRDLTGRFDKLVSIEMIEAVGWQHMGRFFSTCSELLESDGSMLLQAITIDDRAYEVEKASKSFANTHIFPGGCLPSMEVISRSLARRTDMQTVGLEDITLHYVTTLQRWRENVHANSEQLAALGYDERFQRIWELYLIYCEGGFAERRICDVQLLLAKPRYRMPSRGTRGVTASQVPAHALPPQRAGASAAGPPSPQS